MPYKTVLLYCSCDEIGLKFYDIMILYCILDMLQMCTAFWMNNEVVKAKGFYCWFEFAERDERIQMFVKFWFNCFFFFLCICTYSNYMSCKVT